TREPCRILCSHTALRSSLPCRARRNDHARRSQQAVFEAITASSLADHGPFGEFITWLVRDGFVQVRIEFLSDCFDRLQSIFDEEVFQLLQHKAHSGKNRRLLAFAPCCLEPELEMIDNR